MTARQTETLFAPPADQLDAVRRLMLGALLRREVAHPDAEDVVQDVLEAIVRRPEHYAARLGALDEQGPYFVRAALNAYLSRLWREQRRRDRERRHAAILSGAGDIVAQEEVAAWSGEALADAHLSPRQRMYLERVLSGSSVAKIATATNTTPQSVKAVLRRAVASLREQEAGAAASAGERSPK